MSVTTKYHVNMETGRVGVCRATKKGCPLGVDTPHFDTKEQAKEYIEKSEAEMHGTFSTISKKSPKLFSDYKHDDRYAIYGVGKFKKLSSPNDRYWDDNLVVEYRKCENFPEQYFDADKWDDRLTDHEEIAVNGEIIGYISLKTPQRGEASNKVYVFETIEQANDPQAQINNYVFGGRKDAIGDLIRHNQEYVSQPIDLNNPGKYFRGHYKGDVTTKKIDDHTDIIIEEKNYTDYSTYRNVFLIKDGKAVTFIKMSDNSFEDFDGNPMRETQRCDVETRNRDRRKGYARELTEILEKEYDCKLQSGGSFTPLGFAAFGDNPNRTSDQIGMDWNGSNISQTNFVTDWDMLKVPHL